MSHGLMLNHVHMLGRAYLKRPPTTEIEVDSWLRDLVAKIDMKILMGPYSINCETLGNEGVTGAVVIETSHCSGHFWHKVDRPFLMFDVYSCVSFDPITVLNNLNDHFSVENCDFAVIDRNATVAVMETGVWSPE